MLTSSIILWLPVPPLKCKIRDNYFFVVVSDVLLGYGINMLPRDAFYVCSIQLLTTQTLSIIFVITLLGLEQADASYTILMRAPIRVKPGQINHVISYDILAYQIIQR